MDYQPISEQTAQEILYILAFYKEAVYYAVGISGLLIGLLLALIFAVCWRLK